MKKKIFWGLAILILLAGAYNRLKSLPEGLNMEGAIHSISASDVRFLSDRTYVDREGGRHSDQQIFDEAFSMIQGADRYILIDIFFFSDFIGSATTSHRELAQELTDALIAKKNADKDISIQVITDSINEMYGGYASPQFKALRDAGIPVTLTSLTPLRDSNPLYSMLWRPVLRFIPDALGGDFLPNALDIHKPNISLKAYLTSFNFKANHRKVVLADYNRQGQLGFSTLITTGNPHDGSSAHTNTAFKIDDSIWKDVVESERAVAKLSRVPFIEPPQDLVEALALQSGEDGSISVQLLTEGMIEEKTLAELDALDEGDTLDMAMFYLSDRDIIRALKRADDRGVRIRILLDPNKDAFGREKNGIPNRPVAHELISHTKGNTTLRWCDTHGEQCHSKLLILKRGSGYGILQGSANLTRRNLDNLNLETSVWLESPSSTAPFEDAKRFFSTSWDNEEGKMYSTAYETYADASLGKRIWYRIGEATGMSRY